MAETDIARIQLHRVEIPLEDVFYPSWIPGYPQTENKFTLVEIETKGGTTGYSAAPEMVREREGLGELIGPYLLGEDATDIEFIQRRLREISYLGLNNYWIEPAFWDIKAKIRGVPVCELLGGEPREIELYASAGQLRSPVEWTRLARRRSREGFDLLKMRVHHPLESVDREVVEYVSTEIDGEIGLAVDANQGWKVGAIREGARWDLERARRFAEICDECEIEWLEEPLPKENYREQRLLRESCSTPIAGGELQTGGYPELNMMLENGSYDIYQPDAIFTGGIQQTSAFADRCAELSTPYMPHTWTNGIGFAVNLQIFAATEFAAEYPLEYPIDPPWTVGARDAILAESFDHCDGRLRVPDRSGLGFEIDRDALEYYGETFFAMDRKRLIWFALTEHGPRKAWELFREKNAES